MKKTFMDIPCKVVCEFTNSDVHNFHERCDGCCRCQCGDWFVLQLLGNCEKLFLSPPGRTEVRLCKLCVEDFKAGKEIMCERMARRIRESLEEAKQKHEQDLEDLGLGFLKEKS